MKTIVVTAVILAFLATGGCGPGINELKMVEYAPQSGGDFAVSTPQAQGVDPLLVARLYYDAEKLETLYGLLVIRNGKLIAEKYFNKGSVSQVSGRMSATKSYTSALVGVALQKGCLKSVDQKMIDFFPEFADKITDPRKKQITIRQMLQMRAGYPWEGRVQKYFSLLFAVNNWQWLPHLVDFQQTGRLFCGHRIRLPVVVGRGRCAYVRLCLGPRRTVDCAAA